MHAEESRQNTIKDVIDGTTDWQLSMNEGKLYFAASLFTDVIITAKSFGCSFRRICKIGMYFRSFCFRSTTRQAYLNRPFNIYNEFKLVQWSRAFGSFHWACIITEMLEANNSTNFFISFKLIVPI